MGRTKYGNATLSELLAVDESVVSTWTRALSETAYWTVDGTLAYKKSILGFVDDTAVTHDLSAYELDAATLARVNEVAKSLLDNGYPNIADDNSEAEPWADPETVASARFGATDDISGIRAGLKAWRARQTA